MTQFKRFNFKQNNHYGEDISIMPRFTKRDNCNNEDKPIKDFNPFYDSKFLISYEDNSDRRMLVEMYEEESIQLSKEIEVVLKVGNRNSGVLNGA